MYQYNMAMAGDINSLNLLVLSKFPVVTALLDDFALVITFIIRDQCIFHSVMSVKFLSASCSHKCLESAI